MANAAVRIAALLALTQLLLALAHGQSSAPSVGCKDRKKPPPLHAKPLQPEALSPPPACASAYDLISAHPKLTALKNAIDSTGLSDAIKMFNGTLFAPHDEAVNVCYKVGCLTSNTILFHAILGLSYQCPSLIATGNPSQYAMANGAIATVQLWGNSNYTVAGAWNMALVTEPNLPFCSGYLHVVNAVLNPAPAPKHLRRMLKA